MIRIQISRLRGLRASSFEPEAFGLRLKLIEFEAKQGPPRARIIRNH